MVSAYPSTDSHGWYGPTNHIAKALRAAGIDVSFLGAELRGASLPARALKSLSRGRGLDLQLERELAVVREYARQVADHLREARGYDALLFHGTLPLSELDTDVPKIVWADATFAGLVCYYPEFSNFIQRTLRNGHRFEQQALDRADLLIYTSEWARSTAVEAYGVAPEKTAVLQFGANIPQPPTAEEVERGLAARQASGKIRLLCIGGHWSRKGGDIALEAARSLRASGLDVQLRILGMTSPEGLQELDLHVPFIPKAGHGSPACL